jgi:hypothetical protein
MNMKKMLHIVAILVALGYHNALSCGYSEATGGGQTTDIDLPTYKAYSYVCNTCTSTDNHTECFGPYPHWTYYVEDWNEEAGRWDYAWFGNCDDYGTFTCLDS